MTDAEVLEIVKHWSSDQDTWQRDTRWGNETYESWVYPPPPEFIPMKEGYVWRALPDSLADEARNYIREVVKQYPLQLRAVMGYPMWLRFCDVWNYSGKVHLAMRAI